MKEDYHKALEVIFAYDYRCCVFKKNICRDQSEVPDGMHDSSDPLLLEFYVRPRCPPIPAVSKDTTVEVHPSEMPKEPKGNASVEDKS